MKAVKRILLTAFCPCYKCCLKWYRYRKTKYSGRKLWPGDKVLATNGELPVGALVFVPAYGFAYVEDKGVTCDVFIYKWIDGPGIKRYYPASHKAARKWGRKFLDVTIYEEIEDGKQE